MRVGKVARVVKTLDGVPSEPKPLTTRLTEDISVLETDAPVFDENERQLEQLMVLSQQGDRDAFARLCEQRRKFLVNEVRKKIDRRLVARVDASDVIQEVFWDANRRLDEMKDADVPLIAWLRFLVNQKIVDLQRQHVLAQKRSVSRERSLNRPKFDLDSIADQLMADMSSPSHQAHRNELAIQMKLLLSKLSPIDREILVLRHFHDMTNHAVAESLGLSTNAASNRYVRALKRLKEMMDSTKHDIPE